MVNEVLAARAAELLGPLPRRILITGGTGFVGSSLAETLSAAGHEVVAIGRNPYLVPGNTLFQRADIRDADRIAQLCSGQHFVIHCAAKASPWASAAQLEDVNVVGTQNIITGCLKHNVQRLVHVSSTAIRFDFRDALDIAEDASLPRKPSCGYAASKARAEQLVQNACQRGLNAIIVRARAVFGPGDNSLLPRMLHAYDAGKLRQIGDGTNITDMTYIDNLVYALVLAMQHGDSGQAVTVTGGQPVQLWSVLRRILVATGRTKQLPSVSYKTAHRYAHLQELKHRTTKQAGEPVLTRYTTGLLAKSQTFSPVAARQQLEYEPIVSLERGIEATIDALTCRDDSQASECAQLSLHTTGYTPNRLDLAQRSAPRESVRFHAMIGIITHSEHGITLFDTGYAPRYHKASARWPYRLNAKLVPVVSSEKDTALAIIRRNGIEPSSVRRIIVSHFHIDHICGLIDFPNADVIATKSAWNSVAGIAGLTAVRKAYLPALMPDDIEDRLCAIDHFHDPGIGPFEHCHDLFRDGSVRLIHLPGHACGQIGVLLQTGANQRKFLIADSYWTRRSLSQNLRPTLAFRFIADNYAAALATQRKLVEFHRLYPDVEMIPTHCPEVAQQYGFDAALAAT